MYAPATVTVHTFFPESARGADDRGFSVRTVPTTPLDSLEP